MISSLKEFFKNSRSYNSPLDASISISSFCPLDLSISNTSLAAIDIVDPEVCQHYIDGILKKHNAKVAFGGYLEKRNLYADKSNFSKHGDARNIHLGIDFWTTAGTKVIAPLEGRIHSFQNNASIGDYGPTIILQHEIEGFIFHSLYGHLSLESIVNIQVGQEFEKGATLATLGVPAINVNYAPHLHFQLIIDMESIKGDYPGVCSADKLEFYSQNCPDPRFLLKI